MNYDSPQFLEQEAQRIHKDYGRNKAKASEMAERAMDWAEESHEMAQGMSPRDARDMRMGYDW